MLTNPQRDGVGAETTTEPRALLANAPCSYGAFEVTVGSNPNVPDSGELLAMVASAGYAGIDLGPAGYLGTPAELPARLGEHGLGLAGGYLQLPFSEPEALEAAMGELDELLDTLAGCGDPTPPPVPTLADAGAPARRHYPGQAAGDRSLGLDREGWLRLAEGVERVLERCRARGLEPVLHPHAGTYVEAEWEIEELLARTEIGICYDPGHLVVGRVDPVRAQERWSSRITHYHLKDALVDVLEDLVQARADVNAIYASGAFCRLGEGSVNFDPILAEIAASDFAGWLVIEQDLVPDSAEAVARAAEDQVRNLEFVRARGLGG